MSIERSCMNCGMTTRGGACGHFDDCHNPAAEYVNHFVFWIPSTRGVDDHNCTTCMHSNSCSFYRELACAGNSTFAYRFWESKEETMRDSFKKSDLEDRMVVEAKNGKLFMKVGDYLVGLDSYDELTFYSEDLTSALGGYSDCDIVRVYDRVATFSYLTLKRHALELIWERKPEVKEVTLKEIAEKFGVDAVKVIDD